MLFFKKGYYVLLFLMVKAFGPFWPTKQELILEIYYHFHVPFVKYVAINIIKEIMSK